MPPTPYAAHRYFPSAGRHGIALCLSGGGFRAALFHLGAVRRLYELGVLQTVRTITAVSGGSLLAAHLAEHWGDLSGAPLSPAEWNACIAVPFREVTSQHWNMWPQIKGLLLGGNAGVRAVAKRVEKTVTHKRLHDLPTCPDFIICATDLVRGTPWIFHRTTPTNYRVAMAVAVSSCSPILLRPYRPATPERLALVDGGVDDDRGIETVWQTHEALLVSDGGDVLRPRLGSSLPWSWMRSASVLWNASQEIQRRWLLSTFDAGRLKGAYWGIGGSVAHYEDSKNREPYPGYSPALARDLIAPIRTSYDRFSLAEAAVLENHGYLLAEAAIRTHFSGWPVQPAPLRIPNPGWMREDLIRQELIDSATKISG